jgi:hypothetical protein
MYANGIARHHELHATILRATRIGRVVGYRIAFAITGSADTGLPNALGYQIISDGISPFFRELLVVFL